MLTIKQLMRWILSGNPEDNPKMQVINASISADISECSIEQGLLILNPEDMSNVFLLISDNVSFNVIYKILYLEFDLEQTINKFNFSLSNIDTSNVLSDDSWMLIDYGSKKMYYNNGA